MKKFLFLPLFWSWGRYFNRGNWGDFLGDNVIGALGYVFVFFMFNGDIVFSNMESNQQQGAFAFALFLVSARGLTALLERYSDELMSYRFAEQHPVSYVETLVIRLLISCLRPSTVIGGIFLFFNFYVRGVSFIFAFVTTLCTVLFMAAAQQLYAFVSMDLSKAHPLNILLWASTAAVFAAVYTTNIPLTGEVVMVIGIAGMTLALLLLFLLKRKRTRKKNGGQANRADEAKKETVNGVHIKEVALEKGRKLKAFHSRALVRKGITQRRMLMYKECLFLFRHKPEWFFHSLWLFGTLAAGINSEFAFFVLYFNATIAMWNLTSSYALNYLGAEDDDLLPVLIAPVASKSLIRVKTTIFVGISLLTAFVVTCIQGLALHRSVQEMVVILGTAILIISIYTVLINFTSIKYYSVKKDISVEGVQRFLTNLAMFIAVNVIILVIRILPHKELIGGGLVILMAAIALFFTWMKPDYFSDMYDGKRESILRALSTPIKKRKWQE